MNQIPFNIDLFRQGVPAFYDPRGVVLKYTFVKDMPNGTVMCQIERPDGSYGSDIWDPNSMIDTFTMNKPELWVPLMSLIGCPVFYSEEDCKKWCEKRPIGGDFVPIRIYETPYFNKETQTISTQ